MILKYRVMALIGESGSGKDTLAKSVLSRDPEILYPVISCTTRERRENEQDGKDYYFLTPQEFCDKITQRAFIETTTFNSWMYGTPLSSLSLDKINIGVFNPDGIFSMLDNPQIDLYVYRVLCGPRQRLIRQLERDANVDINEVFRRYKADEASFDNMILSEIANRTYFQVIRNEDQDQLNHAVDWLYQEGMYIYGK